MPPRAAVLNRGAGELARKADAVDIRTDQLTLSATNTWVFVPLLESLTSKIGIGTGTGDRCLPASAPRSRKRPIFTMQRALPSVLSPELATTFPRMLKSVALSRGIHEAHEADLLEVKMTITPGELLDTSIAQLRILVAFLSDQLGATDAGLPLESDASEVRACGEVLRSLSALIPEIQVARCAQRGVPTGVSELRRNASFFTHYASARERVSR